MRKLKEFNIYWIEEPTCADDVLGHKAISEVNMKFIKNLDSVVIAVCSRRRDGRSHGGGVSEQSHVQAVSHVRRDAVLSGLQHHCIECDMHAELQMRSVKPEIITNIIRQTNVILDRFCEDEWPE